MALKMKSAKDQQKASPPHRANTPLKTKFNNAFGVQQIGEERIPRQDTVDHLIPSNTKHAEDRILHKWQEAEDNN